MIGQIGLNAHAGVQRGFGAVAVVVIKRIWIGNLVRVVVVILGVVFPRAMRRFMMAHHKEGPLFVASFDPVDTLIGDDIRRIALFDNALAVFNHIGIKVLALSRQHRPVVKASGAVLWPLVQVPFPDDGRLVAGILKVFSHVRHAVVEAGRKRGDAVYVIVGPCQNGCATGRADAIGDVAVI